MTSINDDVESILNGKFEGDLGLGFFNDVTFGLQPPTPFNQMPASGAPAGVVHHSPAMGHSHMTPQMPNQMLPGQGPGQVPGSGPGPGPGPGQAHGLPQPTPQPQQQHPQHPQHPQQHFGAARATPQQMAAQLHQVPGQVPVPGHAQPHVQPHAQPHPATPTMRMTPLSTGTPQMATPTGQSSRSPQVAERVNTLLHINNLLIKQMSSLPPKSVKHAECLKRLETNIAYLHGLATDVRAHQVALTLPQIVQPPDNIPSLIEPYQRLAMQR